jgi:hypothetical protein
MTAAEAAKLGDGALVISRHTIPPWKPLAVEQVWVSAGGAIARLLVSGEKSLRDRWIGSEGLERPPAGYQWHKMRLQWVRTVGGVVLAWEPPAPKPITEE